MIETEIFIGVGVNLETSLFEYGLLVSKEVDKDNQHACIYKQGESYGVAYMSEKEVNSLIEDSWVEKDRFLSYVGMSETEWLELNLVNKLSDMIGYYGGENILGTDYYPFTEEEAIVWLNGFKLDSY